MFFTPSAYYNNRAQTRYRGELSSSLFVTMYGSISPDGTQIFLTQHNDSLGAASVGGDPIISYTLGTPWDISTITAPNGKSGIYTRPSASSVGTNFGSEAQTFGHAFSTDGTKMFTVGNNTGLVQSYTGSTAWNVSTMTSPTRTYEYTASLGASLRAIDFSSDGLTMMLTGNGGKTGRYTLPSAWNIVGGTLLYTASLGFNSDITFENGGLYAFTFSGTGLVRKTFAAPYDIRSVVETQSVNLTSIGVVGNFLSIFFKNDGKKGYISSYSFGGNSLWAFELEGSYDISGPLIIL